MKHIRTSFAPEPGFYNQGVLVDPNSHTFLFLAGQTGNIPGIKDEPVIEGGVLAQTTQTLENLLSVVAAAGGDIHSFVALEVFIKDAGTDEGRAASRKEFAAAYQKFFEKYNVPKDKLPTRCLVWVSEVPLEYPVEDTLVEIKGVAAIPREA